MNAIPNDRLGLNDIIGRLNLIKYHEATTGDYFYTDDTLGYTGSDGIFAAPAP